MKDFDLKAKVLILIVVDNRLARAFNVTENLEYWSLNPYCCGQ